MQDGSEMNHDISDAENYSDSDPMDIEVINPFQGKYYNWSTIILNLYMHQVGTL